MSFFLKVNACCCGCSLRTGTLILSWLTIICAILQFLQVLAGSEETQYTKDASTKSGAIFGCLLNVGVGICAVYAANTKKRGYLLPSIILGTIEVVVMLIALLIVIIVAIGGGLGQYSAVALPVCIILVVFAGLAWYFTSVIHSYYVELGEQNAGRAFSA